MKNLDKRFTIMTEDNLASVNGGKNGMVVVEIAGFTVELAS
ncbi:bacteriocin [Ligilactobacillus salivarius]|nr:bacteriocin [Ligilactobacillus salivarius]